MHCPEKGACYFIALRVILFMLIARQLNHGFDMREEAARQEQGNGSAQRD
jgi:hypothetical protein